MLLLFVVTMGFIYWPVKGEFATPIKSYATDSATTSNKRPFVSDSTMEELAGLLLESYIKRYARANDGKEEEQAAMESGTTSKLDPYQEQVNATKEFHNNIHKKNSDAAKRQTEQAKNRFNRK